MAIKATYEGVNASGYVAYWGYHFPCGEEVLVETDEAIEGVKRHPEFSHKPVKEKAAPAGAADPFDHDGDGAPGGSLPKAKRKAKAKKAAPAAEPVA